MGAQWLSGREIDSRPKGRGFEPHRRHCFVSLSKNINPSLALGQPRRNRPFITERLLMGRKELNQTHHTAMTIEQHMLSQHHFQCVMYIKHMYNACVTDFNLFVKVKPFSTKKFVLIDFLEIRNFQIIDWCAQDFAS